jgi:formylglycine-generating enzyme
LRVFKKITLSAMKKLLKFSFLLAAAVFITSCSHKEKSSTTGWSYNDQKWGGFEKLNYEGQATGPNLVMIEGGTFAQGLTEQDVTFEWNNVSRRITVSSFYMDETEVANIDYREYLYWLEGKYGIEFPDVPNKALPDTLVWRDELSFNEPYVENYFRHPSYDDYPVVGVNWLQANEYCKWRTDRVNEMILIERGILKQDAEQKGQNVFTTDTYLAGMYQGSVRKNLKDHKTGTDRPVKYEDGILLPSYRLPTEAEWEYAALGLQGNMASGQDERITDRRIYPWNGNTVRYQKHTKNQGDLMANFKKGGGDYMGVAGNLNDHASICAPVRSFLPNDFGLYNMAGNVNEWVMDVYRPMTSTTLRDADGHDLNSFRGNKFQKRKLDENGKPVERDSLGRMQYTDVKDDEVVNRENYKRANLYNYMDGDKESGAEYQYGKSSLVSDKARVYKGGSWADRAFWLSPGSRRFKDQDKADRTLGFRCAMTRNGGASGNDDTGGNQFNVKKKKVKRKY